MALSLISSVSWKMLEQRVRKQPCLHVGGGNAEMAMSHFYEPKVNIASPPWVLLSTVHVAAQIKLLNCYLQVASGVWFIYRRVQMFCPVFLFFCLESTFTVVCLLVYCCLTLWPCWGYLCQHVLGIPWKCFPWAWEGGLSYISARQVSELR